LQHGDRLPPAGLGPNAVRLPEASRHPHARERARPGVLEEPIPRLMVLHHPSMQGASDYPANLGRFLRHFVFPMDFTKWMYSSAFIPALSRASIVLGSLSSLSSI